MLLRSECLLCSLPLWLVLLRSEWARQWCFHLAGGFLGVVGGRRCHWSRLVLSRRRAGVSVFFFRFFFRFLSRSAIDFGGGGELWLRFWRFGGDGSLLCFLFPVALSTQSVVALLLLLVTSVLQAKPSFNL